MPLVRGGSILVEALDEVRAVVFPPMLERHMSWLSIITPFFFVIFSECVAFEEPSLSFSERAWLMELSRRSLPFC